VSLLSAPDKVFYKNKILYSIRIARYYFLDLKDKGIANYLYLNKKKCIFPIYSLLEKQKKADLVLDLCIIFVYLH
jgi:hypothetical protein